VEPLLVDEAAHQQHQALARLRVLRAQGVEVGVHVVEVVRVDPVRDHGDARGGHAEGGAHVAAHVVGAGDHVVGAADHLLLDRVDVGLRVPVDPALVTAELGGVNGDEPGPSDRPRERLGGAGHEPVVRVHQVEVEALAQLGAQHPHVGVHRVHPANEGVHVLGVGGLPDAVDDHPVPVLLGGQPAAAAGEHVHLCAIAHQLLGQLANVPSQSPFHDRRVLP
jgi:hypothetical protein